MARILQDFISPPVRLHPRDQSIFEEIVDAILAGVEDDKIHAKVNVPPGEVDAILQRQDFEGFFRDRDSTAYTRWHDARTVEHADTEATTFLRRNLLKNVQALQALVDDPKALDPDKRAQQLNNLIKMGGIKGDETPVQVVKLSEDHLAALTGVFGEKDGINRPSLSPS